MSLFVIIGCHENCIATISYDFKKKKKSQYFIKKIDSINNCVIVFFVFLCTCIHIFIDSNKFIPYLFQHVHTLHCCTYKCYVCCFCQYCLLSNTESKEIIAAQFNRVNKAYINYFKLFINVVIMS